MDDRVTELEIKVAQMEDYLNTLNDALIRQQASIEALEGRIERLNERLLAAGGVHSDSDPSAEKPPQD